MNRTCTLELPLRARPKTSHRPEAVRGPSSARRADEAWFLHIEAVRRSAGRLQPAEARQVFGRALCILATCILAAPLAAQAPVSEEAIRFFQQNCASCHTIGGGALAGPDLRGATERKDEEWQITFILDPKRVIDSGDPYAAQLLREARGVYMPQIPGLDRALATRLVTLIAAESALETSRFAGLQLSDRPLTPADVERGARLFIGAESLSGGGPACNSCHTVQGIGGLAGGRLGPDLTSVFARMESRKALAAWLSAPPSLVMQPLYARQPLEGEELLALVAYLQQEAATGLVATPERTLELLLAGLAGALLLLVLFDLLWRRRFRAVRRPLVARLRSPLSASQGSRL